MHALQHSQTVPLAPAAGTYATCVSRPGLTAAADAQAEGRSVPMPNPTPPLCLLPLPEPDGERTDGRVQGCSMLSSAVQPSAWLGWLAGWLAGFACMGAVSAVAVAAC